MYKMPSGDNREGRRQCVVIRSATIEEVFRYDTNRRFSVPGRQSDALRRRGSWVSSRGHPLSDQAGPSRTVLPRLSPPRWLASDLAFRPRSYSTR